MQHNEKPASLGLFDRQYSKECGHSYTAAAAAAASNNNSSVVAWVGEKPHWIWVCYRTGWKGMVHS